MDPATAAMVVASLVGEKQTGTQAPAFQSGGMGSMLPMGGINLGLGDGPLGTGDMGALAMLQNSSQGGVTDVLGQQPQTSPQMPIGAANTQEQSYGGFGQKLPIGGFEQNAIGQGGGDQEMNPLDKFFGNMDQNLQSPSKLIGMGLLGQIDPRLGYGGLLASGLFGENKIFGK